MILSLKDKIKLLSARDFELLVTLSEQIHETNSDQPFLNHLYTVLKQAVPNTIFSIDCYSVNPVHFEQAVSEFVSDELAAIHRRYLRQHPLLKRLVSVQKTGVYTILSEITPEKFHKTNLYQQFYKVIGVEDQLIFRLLHISGAYIVTYSRDTAFSEKERVFMELLKPQVATALKNWRRIRDLENDLRTLAGSPDEIEHRVETEANEKKRLGSLTSRQREIAELVAQGLENRQIAETLNISTKTVGKHIENIFEALNIHNRAALASMWQNEMQSQTMYGDLKEP